MHISHDIDWNDEEMMMHLSRCMECGMSTYQKDHQCVICKIGLKQIHNELISLLIEDGNIVLLQKLQ
jgi:predicted Zn-ribbon and HTH transcriptional regulator